MKKILLSFMAAMGLAASANAQLPEGSVFPDFTLTTITGQSIHLDSLLNAGYTVFIDISATWCNPCWDYHIGHHLDSLYEQHGPTGWSGVNVGSTNDVVVLFVQGEPTSNLAELYDGPGATVGSASVETPHSTSSQGNWVAGTPYPIVDDTTSTDPVVGTSALGTAWDITYFPTVYMICRDHLVHVMQQPSAVDAYTAAQAVCPNYAPAAGSSVDAKAVAYQGNGYFVCNANPTVSFQNYSATSTITAATLTVTDATGTTVGTEAWTGSLAPYDVANVAVPAFAGTSFGGYKYAVTVAGDVNTANDISADSVFVVYDSTNSVHMPVTYVESFGNPYLSYKYAFPDPNGLVIWTNQLNNPADPGAAINIIGPSGSADTAIVFDDYDAINEYGLGNYAAKFVLGNYNTEGTATYSLAFDESYAATSGATTTDNLQVLVSTDCGDTWTPTWSATGTALETAPSVTPNWFVPGAATQWKHVVASLGAKSSNLMIEISGTDPASGGQSIFVDNIGFINTTAVAQVNFADQVSVYPNPAKEMAFVSLNLLDEADIQVELSDAVGRVITTINQHLNAGAEKIEVPTANLPTGLYNVKIVNGTSVTVKKLSVIE